MEVRYVLIAGHYHKQLNFTMDSLSAARQALQTLFRLDENLQKVSGPAPAPSYQELLQEGLTENTEDPFAPAWVALLKDLNTPEALGHVFVAAKEIEAKLRANALPVAEALKIRRSFQRLLQGLGLKPEAPVAEEAPPEIAALAQQRWEAKQAKDWAKADTLRQELSTQGWTMQDRKDGFSLVKN
jgi:cysteinyl-tRNA synthetase